MYASHAKCVFGQTWVKYLGHIIVGSVIQVDPDKMHTIMDCPEPTCINHV